MPRLTHFIEESNTGKGFIKEQCFSPCGRWVVFPTSGISFYFWNGSVFYINTLIWDVGIFMARRNDFFNENCSLSWNLMILDVKNLSWFNFHQFRKKTSERPALLLEMAFDSPACFDAATASGWLRLHPACCLQCAILWWTPMTRRTCYLVLWTVNTCYLVCNVFCC